MAYTQLLNDLQVVEDLYTVIKTRKNLFDDHKKT